MITIKLGDITQEDVEAIVNAANTGLRGGGGVDGAIHRAAGPTVMEECRKIGACPTGEAVITNAGNLKARKIIHTAGPVWNGGKKDEAGLLRNCYRNSFLLAKKNLLKTIAFPAISTGVYGYPIEGAARIALSVGREFEKDFDEIRYICFSQRDLQVYRLIWDEMAR
ncbi:MAG: O-acetyl-ADP-ribose deacetylase [Candidatus Omnitrophota bacterium]|jgi:O-acetyl-ADP-ribose deacetylase (regulator of RNase III)|nr:O-acetyl-ADP-ribose deacetylase [Candidatus Omnitrophota bacterium]MDD5138150.1 O-acetyl-ADP-ribose deacetylase [Candidatus Omnitrophota bacterium]